MPGIVGGAVSDDELTRATAAMEYDPWHERVTFGGTDHGFGLTHHGTVDPGGWTVWSDGRRHGAIYGALTRRPGGLADDESLFTRLLDEPVETLAAVDGPALVAATDTARDRSVVGTDRIGSRFCFYTPDGPVRFASELGALAETISTPRLDRQAAADLLLMEHPWGYRTLLDGVVRLPAASALVIDGDEHHVSRYWTRSYEPQRKLGADELAEQYRGAVSRMAGTVDGDLSLYLSGGLDSRAMASALAASDGVSLAAYTYDSNPPGAGNPELAGRVADSLDIDISTVTVDLAELFDRLEDMVDRTDGMVTWTRLIPLVTAYRIAEERQAPLVEACGQGGLLGEMPWRAHLTMSDPVEAQLAMSATSAPETVRRVFADDIDPTATFKAVADQSNRKTTMGVILDAHHENYYPWIHWASTRLYRSSVGSRTPCADETFLEHVTPLPTSDRLGSIPGTRGAIPAAVSKPKLRLARGLGGDPSRIPYERTKVAPNRPLAAHLVGYVASETTRRAVRFAGLESPAPIDRHRTDETIRRRFEELLDAVGERPFFDADAIRTLRDEHFEGDRNHIKLLAGLTTLEIWCRQVID